MTCFGRTDEQKHLDSIPVPHINPDLTGGVDVTQAIRLWENMGLCFEGDQKGGPFELDWSQARKLLVSANPVPKSNADVLSQRVNGRDVTGRWEGGWVVDYGTSMTLAEAAEYQDVLASLDAAYKEEAQAKLAEGKPFAKRAKWWLHKCPRPKLRSKTRSHARVLVTVRVATHRFFAWVPAVVLPDSRLFVFSRSDDYWMGLLSSSVHALWALAKAPPHGLGNDPTYSATTCFDTFALPWAPGSEPNRNPLHAAISTAAKQLHEMRERWLNPPEWIQSIAAAIDAQDKFEDVPAEARPLIRQSAIMAAAAKDPNLKKRTLTNLYNERPTWLRLAHRKLDEAVLAAYAAVDPKGQWSKDWADVWEDAGAGQALGVDHPLYRKRQEVEAKALANLLRLNKLRCQSQLRKVEQGHVTAVKQGVRARENAAA